MGFRLYKSVSLGKGVRLNLSKTGVGISAGVPGARYSMHSSGRRVRTFGAPGTGIYHRTDTYAGHRQRSRGRQRAPAPVSVAPIYPKAGLFAPKGEKLFVRSVTAYMQSRPADALGYLREAEQRNAGELHVGEEFFSGLCLVERNKLDEAIPFFEKVLASDHEIPDPLMRKYRIGGLMQVQVTPGVLAEMSMSNVAVALMLAEAYQRTNRARDAIELLESLGSVSGEDVFALSLAELYSSEESWDEVVRVTEGFSNEEETTAEILLLRADALLELGMADGALEVSKEVLRSKKRRPETLRAARYVRALALEKAGRKAQARKELEKIYAEDSDFQDVAKRLGRDVSRASTSDAPKEAQ